MSLTQCIGCFEFLPSEQMADSSHLPAPICKSCVIRAGEEQSNLLSIFLSPGIFARLETLERIEKERRDEQRAYYRESRSELIIIMLVLACALLCGITIFGIIPPLIYLPDFHYIVSRILSCFLYVIMIGFVLWVFTRFINR